MTRSSDPRLREFYRLAAAHCESKLSDEQATRLSRILTDEPDLRRLFTDYMQVHAMMERNTDSLLGGDEAPSGGAPVGPVEATASSLFPNLLDGTLDAIHWSRHPGRFCLVVCAVTSLVWISFFGLVLRGIWPDDTSQRIARRVEPLREIARIARGMDVKWANPDTAPLGPHLYKGARLNLAEGFLQLQYATGAELLVEAPALVTVVGVNMLHIERGRLTASVPTLAVGFVVSTPSATVVDLGTQFGVSVNETGEQTDLRVFTGKVEAELMLASVDCSSGTKQVVTAGHTLRLDARTGKTTTLKHFGDRFVRKMPVKPGGVCANLKIINPSFEEPDVRNHRLFRPGAGDVALITAPGWRANRWSNTLDFQQGRCMLSPWFGGKETSGEGDAEYGPAASDGRQVAKMTVIRRGIHNPDGETHAWLYQSLGVVAKADVGKTLTLAVDAASRARYPESCKVVPKDGATVAAAFVLGVSDTRAGRQVGRPGRHDRLLRTDGTITLHASLTIGRELVGRELSVLLLVVDLDPSNVGGHGSHYHFDNVRCEVSNGQ